MNAIANLAATVSPEAMAAGAPEELKVGHINHGAAIYDAFVVDAEKQGLTTLETVREIAVSSSLTNEEFADACKKAQKIADGVDSGNGFKATEDAKGIEKYGPKRRLLNQRLSEAKQLFGVFKMAPQILVEMGYWAALAKARDYLTERTIKWDGSPALSADEKADKKAASVRTQARVSAMDSHPQKKGESDDDYLLRVRALMAEAVDKAEQEQFNKDVESLYSALTKKHDFALLAGVMQLMLAESDTDSLESLQHWIQEEIVIRTIAAQ